MGLAKEMLALPPVTAALFTMTKWVLPPVSVTRAAKRAPATGKKIERSSAVASASDRVGVVPLGWIEVRILRTAESLALS